MNHETLSSPAASRDSQLQTGLRSWAMLTLGGLLVQNLLGISVNLYISLPRPVTGFLQLLTINLILASHILVGFTLVGLSAVVLVLTMKNHSPSSIIGASALGLSATVLAGVMGFIYSFGTQDNPEFSFLMEAFFAIAVGFEILVVYFVSIGKNVVVNNSPRS